MNIPVVIGGIAFLGIVGAVLRSNLRQSFASGMHKKSGNPKSNNPHSTDQSQADIILNSVEDGVVVVDMQNVIRLFNPAAARITGWEQTEATGIDYTAVLHVANDKNQEFSTQTNPFARVLQTGKVVRENNATMITKSKKSVAIALSVSPLLDPTNQVTGAVGIFRDVSEERQEERQRAEFISTASHEMRTPVAAIEGYLALSMNEKVSTIDTRARTYLQKAHEATQHLGQLFQDLLTSAKAEDGRISNHPVLTEMSGFLERMTDDLRFAAQKKNLNMEYIVGTTGANISPDGEGHRRVVQPLYYAYIDPERMREVVTNLFDNAVKYTQAGKIQLGITGDDKVVQIYVRDTGTGIAPEDMPHLFQKFYRIDNTATRTIGGTGLGLFIARKIVELYQGKIWVESTLGEGSTFYINLPRTKPEEVPKISPTNGSTAPGQVTTPTIGAHDTIQDKQ